jgi:hypothetical protein
MGNACNSQISLGCIVFFTEIVLTALPPFTIVFSDQQVPLWSCGL